MVVFCFFTSALITYLVACGGSGSSFTSKATKGYAVADYDNNRLLIYNAPFSTNQNAGVVLGQADFTHGSSLGYAANTLTPYAVAADSSGNLYVDDFEGCRVLQFKPPFTNNMNASVVIGEPDFTSRSCTATANTIELPLAVAIDGNGNLWVAERYTTSRILEFVPPFSNGMNATLVIGQNSLTNSLGCNQGLAAPTASTICGSEGMTFDASGDLWVADSGNERVLEFKPPFATGMAASVELGQPSATAFTSVIANNGGQSASTVNDPNHPAFDASGNLWVTDAFNQRVLEYTPPFSNGMAATMEVGQPSATAFTSNTENTSQSGFKYPCSLSFDPSGNMQVVDCQNNRVLVFDTPFSNGMNATLVLGQANFTSGAVNQGGSTGANTLDQASGVVAF
jgi:sugar lactone lactonase YvrE